eukprot:5994036-Amphidinium_carterae.1
MDPAMLQHVELFTLWCQELRAEGTPLWKGLGTCSASALALSESLGAFLWSYAPHALGVHEPGMDYADPTDIKCMMVCCWTFVSGVWGMWLIASRLPRFPGLTSDIRSKGMVARKSTSGS